MKKLYTFPDPTIDRQFQEVIDSANKMQFKDLPAPPDLINEYVLATQGGRFYWKAVVPSTTENVSFGGEGITFGGQETTW